MLKYLLVLLAFVVFIVPAYAQESYTYDYYPGSLKFDTILDDLSCDSIIPNPTVHVANSLDIDGMDDYFFIILGKTDSGKYHYMQIQIPDNGGKQHRESYLLDFQNQTSTVYGGLYQDYSQLAVYLEMDDKSKPLDDNPYKKFLTGQSPVVTHGKYSFGPEDYNLHAILFQSDRSNWIKDEACAISVSWQVQVDDFGNITTGEVQTQVGRIYPFETDSDALAETDKIIEQSDAVQEPESDSNVDLSSTQSIAWLNENGADYTVNGWGILRLDNSDLNINKQLIDIPVVHVWSNTDPKGILVDVVETDPDTGVFYADIALVDVPSSHLSLQVSSGDTVTVSFDDKLTDTVKITSKYLPPRKQIESGIQPNEITCKESLVMITKYDGSPVCVQPETKTKLIERGWVTVDQLENKIITPEDNDKLIDIKKGESFVVKLDSGYDWRIDIDNKTVVDSDYSDIRYSGSQGVYRTLNSGHAILTGIGDPLCLSLDPPCMSPSILFQLNINVK